MNHQPSLKSTLLVMLVSGAAFGMPGSCYGQFMTLQPGSSGSIEMGTRALGGSLGQLGAVFNDPGLGNNGNYGRLVDPSEGFNLGNAFQSINGLRGGRFVASAVNTLVPGIAVNAPRGADGAGNPNNFGPGRMDLFANNSGIWTSGTWALSDPKPANGDGSVIEAQGDGIWRANQNLNNKFFGLGIGFSVNLVAPGNYVALGLTGAYRVQAGGAGAWGAWDYFTPVVYAADGPGGNADFIQADKTSANTPFLKDGNAANDKLTYSTWGQSRLKIGAGGNPGVNAGDKVEFKVFFTAMVDPGAEMDFANIPSGEADPVDFGPDLGTSTAVPEPADYAAATGSGLAAFAFWRRKSSNRRGA
jgi:hypothetical protein